MARKINWATYRATKKREQALRAQVESLRKLILDKTGLSPEDHFVVDFGKLQLESPRAGVYITGVQTPT